MTSNRYSRIATLAFVCVLAISVAVPAAAVSVDSVEVPAEEAAGTQISASFTLDNLYQEPQWEPWALQGETELQNVTWTLTFVDASGNEFDTRSYDGQSFSHPDISSNQEILGLRVDVVGDVPELEQFTYPEKESFVVATLTQTRGENGSHNDIGTWNAHHYTTGTEMEPGSREARQAISSAEGAVVEAQNVGADPADANETLQNARQFYELGQFANSIEQADRAEEQADEARENYESSRETNQLLMYAGAAAVVVALLGGGFWYYRQQQDSYDKLG